MDNLHPHLELNQQLVVATTALVLNYVDLFANRMNTYSFKNSRGLQVIIGKSFRSVVTVQKTPLEGREL